MQDPVRLLTKLWITAPHGSDGIECRVHPLRKTFARFIRIDLLCEWEASGSITGLGLCSGCSVLGGMTCTNVMFNEEKH
jgi:hypothetical protein